MAVDRQHVYWSNNGSDAIGRANLDGSGANQNFIAGASNAYGVAIDRQHVYWSNNGSDAIGRANLDGLGANQNFITGANGPLGVAVDRQHVYWANASDAIGRANLDGSGANPSFIAGANFPYGVAVDGLPAARASASPTSLSFATQPVGTFGPPQTLTITNRGLENLEIDTARIASGDVDDFLVSYDTCSSSTLTIGATARSTCASAPAPAASARRCSRSPATTPPRRLRLRCGGRARGFPGRPLLGGPATAAPPRSPGQTATTSWSAPGART